MTTEPDDSRTTRRLALIPPALLLAVALSQGVLVARAGLSPWKGGAFGMFSTTDYGPSRHVRVDAIDADGERALQLSDGVRPLVGKVELGPVVPLATRLARRVAADARAAGDDVRRVRVRVTRLTYDRAYLEPREELVREVEVDVAPR